jgi:hypothetical protein
MFLLLDDYLKAQQKCNKAEDESNLDTTENEEVESGIRSSKRKRR